MSRYDHDTLHNTVVFLFLAIFGTGFAGWVTHVLNGIKAVSQNPDSLGNWAILVLGTVFAPFGAIHGIGQWFGAW